MMSESFMDGRVTLHQGDSRDVLKSLADASIDSVVTDPPYALVSIGKRFGKPGAAPAQHGKDGLYARASSGFMGQGWDTGETAFAAEFWAEVLRVLRPGGHLIAFSGTRTYHRMTVAIEDAGFEIRDQLAWVYGSGFPKSHNLEGDHKGWGTALKPAWEPIALARKPLTGTVAETVLGYGTGALNIDSCRVGDEIRHAAFTSLAPCKGNRLGAVGTAEARRGTQGDVKEYVGRWPANIVHDGSDEVIAAFPDAAGQLRAVGPRNGAKDSVNCYGDFGPREDFAPRGDCGTAARFFYCAKAGDADRLGSKHPTVKPVALMQWLCRLVTPPGGVVLDPFAGSGTTGEAAWREGISAILIEREEAYCDDIRRRMALCLAGPRERTAAIADARGKVGAVDELPLFGGEAAE